MSTEDHGSKVSNAQWNAESAGKRWQYAFFALMIRATGRRFAYLCMYVVVLWYVCFCPWVRRRCRFYLDRRFPEIKNHIARAWHNYLRIVALGRSLVDRAAYGILGPTTLHPDFPESHRLQELLEEGNGLIIVNSHVGNWQVALSAFSFLETPVSIVMHHDNKDIDPRWFQNAGRDMPFSIIDPQEDMGGVLQMISALQQNHVLCLMGDRVFGNDPNTLEASFLGGAVRFPVSPYRLASMKGTPIAVMMSQKSGFSTYRLEIADVIRVPANLGRSNKAYEAYLQRFVEALEEYCIRHPWQFYNFHNMWEPTSQPSTTKHE
ncbi:MAG: lysophospholipid acyltransferase family protein [Planctomycetes bacterium]|nr:lysophospholipid acyltransferase family protein [Planctomycetota bacterium]